MTDTALTEGRIVGIAGPVIDAEFPQGELPEINTALEFDVEVDGNTVTIVAEVAQQIGDSRVRAIAMKPTDGLTRGTPVRNTGQGITVPVGDDTLGHVFNVVGQGLDDPNAGVGADRWGIHRSAPSFDSLEPKAQMFETGVKVIDLLTPYPAHPVPAGRQDRPVRRRRRGQDGAHHRDDQPRRHQPRWRVGVRRRGRAHP